MKCPDVRTVEYFAENMKSDPHRCPVTKVIYLTHHSSLPDCVSSAIHHVRPVNRDDPETYEE